MAIESTCVVDRKCLRCHMKPASFFYDIFTSGNAIQLSLYYGIGRYVSINLQQAHWGAKALDTISDRLQRELPGLRG